MGAQIKKLDHYTLEENGKGLHNIVENAYN